MRNDIAKTSIGRVALLSSRPILALVAAMFVADLLGSMGWVQGRIRGETLFYVFGNPVSNWGVMMTMLIWMLTTGIQMVSSGMAYRAKTNPYMAGVGFYIWLFGSIFSRTSLKFNSANYGSVFTIEYGKLAKEWSGMAFLIALYWPSQIFDMATDASFYLTTPLRAFNLLFAFSSLVSEQLAYMASAAKSLGDEALDQIRGHS